MSTRTLVARYIHPTTSLSWNPLTLMMIPEIQINPFAIVLSVALDLKGKKGESFTSKQLNIGTNDWYQFNVQAKIFSLTYWNIVSFFWSGTIPDKRMRGRSITSYRLRSRFFVLIFLSFVFVLFLNKVKTTSFISNVRCTAGNEDRCIHKSKSGRTEKR